MLARCLASEAEVLFLRPEGDAEIGLLLAAESLAIRSTPQGFGAAQHGLRLCPARVSAVRGVRRMWAVAASAEGKLAFAGHGMPIEAVDVRTGAYLWHATPDSYVMKLAFSADSSALIAACVDGTVLVLDATTGEETARVRADSDILAIAGSARGSRIALARTGDTCALWQCGGRPTVRYLQCGEACAAITISADGKRLATGDRDGLITVFDADGRMRIAKFRHRGAIQALEFAQSGRLLASGSRDGTVRLWDVAERREVDRFRLGSAVSACSLSADTTLLLAAADSGAVRVWRLADSAEVARCTHPQGVTAAAFASEGRIIAAGPDAGCSAWKLQQDDTGLLHRGAVLAATSSRNGSRIATAAEDRRTRVWDSRTGSLIAEFNEPYPARSLALDREGMRLATSAGDRRASVWDVASGELIAALEHPSGVGGLAFAGSGRLATAGYDGIARVWNLTGDAPDEFRHEREISSVAFENDKSLATASWDGTARLWDAESGAELLRLEHDAPVEGVALSRDGARVVTASGNNVRLFDSGGRLAVCLPHAASVQGIALDATGAHVATACADGAARVWDAFTGEELVRIPDSNPAAAVAFCRDGRALVIALNKPEAPIWTWDTNTILEQARARVTRTLTPDERREYLGEPDLH